MVLTPSFVVPGFVSGSVPLYLSPIKKEQILMISQDIKFVQVSLLEHPFWEEVNVKSAGKAHNGHYYKKRGEAEFGNQNPTD